MNCDDLNSEKHLIGQDQQQEEDTECPSPPAQKRRRTAVQKKRVHLLPVITILTRSVQISLISTVDLPHVMKLITRHVFKAPCPIPQIWDAVLQIFSCFCADTNQSLDTVDATIFCKHISTLSEDLLYTTCGSQEDVKTLEDLLRTSLGEYLNSTDQTDSGSSFSTIAKPDRTFTSSTTVPSATDSAVAGPSQISRTGMDKPTTQTDTKNIVDDSDDEEPLYQSQYTLPIFNIMQQWNNGCGVVAKSSATQASQMWQIRIMPYDLIKPLDRTRWYTETKEYFEVAINKVNHPTAYRMWRQLRKEIIDIVKSGKDYKDFGDNPPLKRYTGSWKK